MSRQPHIQMHSPRRTWLVRGVLLSLVVVSGYLIFELGRIKAGYDIVDAATQRLAYENRIVELEDEIVGLKQDVALLETHRDIDREAYKEVESSLSSLQAKIVEQQDALAFYRGIVSPADGKPGIRVQDLTLTRGDEERHFNVHLVLVQSMLHDRKVSGDVQLTVQGSQDGEDASYELSQLLPENADSGWPFSFRYFQNFDRRLLLPDGFTPRQVRVEVRSKTRSIASIEESFDWVTAQG